MIGCPTYIFYADSEAINFRTAMQKAAFFLQVIFLFLFLQRVIKSNTCTKLQENNYYKIFREGVYSSNAIQQKHSCS